MKVRVVHNDGRDELYTEVIKFINTSSVYLIYTELGTFVISASEVGFTQAWDEGSE